MSGLGGTRNWKGTQPGQLTRTGQRNIPYYVASCHTIKLGRWPTARELAGHWSVRMSSYIGHHLYILILRTVITNCSILVIISPLFFCPFNLYLNPQILLFFLLILYPHPAGGGSERLYGVKVLAELIHDRSAACCDSCFLNSNHM